MMLSTCEHQESKFYFDVGCCDAVFNCVTVTGGGCKKCCSSLLLLLYSMKSIKSADNKREEMRGAKKVLF